MSVMFAWFNSSTVVPLTCVMAASRCGQLARNDWARVWKLDERKRTRLRSSNAALNDFHW